MNSLRESLSPDQKQRMTMIHEVLHFGLLRLKFPAELENEYARADIDKRWRHFWISSLISLVIYNGFLIADYLLIPDVFVMVCKLRLLVFSPLCLLGVGIMSRYREKLGLQHQMSLDWAVLVTGVFAALTLSFALSLTQSPMADFYHAGFTVVIMYGNLVQRLRFWSAVGFSLTILVIQGLGIALFPNSNARLIWPIVSLTLVTAAFSLCANFVMERDQRRRFLLTMREQELVKSLSEVNQQLLKLSRVDVLTALFNRRHFQDYLQDIWQRSSQGKLEVAIIMMDVDHFKGYNDHYGHPAGDECLKQVAAVMQSGLRRPGDMVARYGGEEFIAVLPSTSLEEAVQAAQRVRQAVEALGMRHEKSLTSEVVTVSLGVACCNASAANASPDALIDLADRALYKAKHQGRNQVCSD